MIPSLKQRILAHGPITIADYMAEALGYYYATRDPLGSTGDFTTAPEISQLFGEMLGVWCASLWMQMGSPAQVMLVELGPGRGTLMADILRATRHVPGFHQALSIHMVETSPTLRAKQQQILTGYPVHFHTSFSELPEGNFILVANEFFDALPIHQYVKTATGWNEKRIGLTPDTGDLCFVASPFPDSQLQHAHPNAPVGATLELCPAGIAIIQEIAARLSKHMGGALIIDYGYDITGNRTEYGDTLQALKNHQFLPVLEQCGEADITAHVDFAALKNAATGVNHFGAISQAQLLEALGIRLRAEMLMKNASPAAQNTLRSGLERLTSPQEMGELFKAIAITSPTITHLAGFTL